MSGGMKGTTDFVGYSIGQGVPVVTGVPFAGLHGLIDFVGYAVGAGLGGAQGRGPKVGGKKRLYQYLLMVEKRDTLLNQFVQQALERRIFQMWEESERQRQDMLWNNALAVLAAEV